VYAATAQGSAPTATDLNGQSATVIAECERQIARLERMNPAQVAAMANFWDLALLERAV